MSDIIYNESLIDGKSYQKGDWKKFARHNNKEIKGFFGDYKFLSNFEEEDAGKFQVQLNGFKYRSVEAAYQAVKSSDWGWQSVKYRYENISARDAQKNSKKIIIRKDWDKIKKDVMFCLVFQKFNNSFHYRNKLFDTGIAYLEETNWWGDTFWGVDIKLGGKNYLGKMLMKIRNILK